jgi:hypothetical protein
VACIWLGPGVPGAGAGTVQTGCTGLQNAMNAARTGDTIVLTELCTGQNFDYTGNQSFTLAGQAGSTAGFNGGPAAVPFV